MIGISFLDLDNALHQPRIFLNSLSLPKIKFRIYENLQVPISKLRCLYMFRFRINVAFVNLNIGPR
jgi:hypothetical protein